MGEGYYTRYNKNFLGNIFSFIKALPTLPYLKNCVEEFLAYSPKLYYKTFSKLTNEEKQNLKLLLLGGTLHQDKIIPLKYLCFNKIIHYKSSQLQKLPVELREELELYATYKSSEYFEPATIKIPEMLDEFIAVDFSRDQVPMRLQYNSISTSSISYYLYNTSW